MDITTVLLYQPIYNLLIVFYRVFGGDLGLAIIAIAALSRLLTFPITMRQIKMAEKGQEFNERTKEIKKKYKNNKEKQQQELMKVQSEYLPGQLGGCFSLIIQFVLLINILNVIRNLFEIGVGSFNEVAYSFVPQFAESATINTKFLGVIDLTLSPGSLGSNDLVQLAPYVLLAILVGLTQFASSRILMGLRKKKESNKPDTKKKSNKNKAKKVDEPEDFSEIMQRSTQQTMMIFPILIVFMALNFPAGLSLYWTVQSGLVIIQQLLVDRFTQSKKS